MIVPFHWNNSSPKYSKSGLFFREVGIFVSSQINGPLVFWNVGCLTHRFCCQRQELERSLQLVQQQQYSEHMQQQQLGLLRKNERKPQKITPNVVFVRFCFGVFFVKMAFFVVFVCDTLISTNCFRPFPKARGTVRLGIRKMVNYLGSVRT